ncbi:MAG: tetratricopeptide repeat protein, partial [Planctomycetales bacterium]
MQIRFSTHPFVRFCRRAMGSWLTSAGVLIQVASALGGIVSNEMELTPQAIELSDRIPEINQAMRRFRKGDRAGALQTLELATRSHPELPPAKIMLARMLLFSSRVAEARQLLEQAAAEHPDHPGSFALFGNLALNEGRLADAQALYEKVRLLADETPLPASERQRYRIRGWAGVAAVA